MSIRGISKACVFCAIAVGVACGRHQAGPAAQTTTGVQPRNEPTVVHGCLRQGSAGEFVLTATSGAETGQPTTYHLDAPATMKLADYVGQRIGVSGTIRAEQEVATTGSAVPEKPAKDVNATPIVRSESALDVRRLDVTNVTPSGAKCDEGSKH